LASRRRKRKDAQRRKRNKILLISSGTVLAIFVVVAVVVVFLGQGITFEEAKDDSALRDAYIEQVVKRIGKPSSVTVVNYVDTPEEIKFLDTEYPDAGPINPKTVPRI